MKSLFLRLLFLCFPLLVFANTSYYKVTKIRSDDALNVRIDRSIHARKIGELAYNAKNIKVLQCKNSYSGEKWCHIVYRSRGASLKGWVSARYITKQRKNIAKNIAINNKKYKVVNIRSDDTLSVRRRAGRRYTRVGDLAYNARRIEVIKCAYTDRGRKWCKIRHQAYGQSLKGWVSAKYLKSYSGSTRKTAYTKKYPAYEKACYNGDSTACFYLSSHYEGRSQKKYHTKGCRLLQAEYEDYEQREYYRDIRRKIRRKLKNHACL